jgi:glycosyltransferase involved in cell wall biosynthesis
MAMGKALIVSRHIFRPLFEDGEEVLFCGLDAQELARMIIRLHHDPSLFFRLRLAARQFAEQNLGRPYWIEVYRSVLLNSGMPGATNRLRK